MLDKSGRRALGCGRNRRGGARHQEVRGYDRKPVAQFVERVKSITKRATAIQKCDRPLLAWLGHEEIERLAYLVEGGARGGVKIRQGVGGRKRSEGGIEGGEGIAHRRDQLRLAAEHGAEPQVFLDLFERAQKIHDLILER